MKKNFDYYIDLFLDIFGTVQFIAIYVFLGYCIFYFLDKLFS